MRDVRKSPTRGSFGKESFKLSGEEGAWLGFESDLLLEQTMQGTVGRNSLREETGKRLTEIDAYSDSSLYTRCGETIERVEIGDSEKDRQRGKHELRYQEGRNVAEMIEEAHTTL